MNALPQVLQIEISHERCIVLVLAFELLFNHVFDWRCFVLQKGVVVVEKPQEFVGVFDHEIELEFVELVVIKVHFSLSWLIDFGTLLLHCLLQIGVDFGA